MNKVVPILAKRSKNMREPRRGLPWSTSRIKRRFEYSKWMESQSWLDARKLWFSAWVDLEGRDPYCLACGGNWTLQHGDLHHRSYERLGHERFDDLMPLCRSCHDKVHKILESSPSWRKLNRGQASDLIVGKLRKSQENTSQVESASLSNASLRVDNKAVSQNG